MHQYIYIASTKAVLRTSGTFSNSLCVASVLTGQSESLPGLLLTVLDCRAYTEYGWIWSSRQAKTKQLCVNSSVRSQFSWNVETDDGHALKC